jgi:glycosyltransferase involved in cell wall biosynthesis
MHSSWPDDSLITVVAFAFSCEPARGSEPGVGYSFARALAQLSATGSYRILLLTRPHTVQRIRRALAAEVPGARIDVVPVSIPMWLVRLTKVRRVRIAYVVWQAKAVRKAREVLRQIGGRKLVHHITFASDVMPTFERFLPRDVPRVFGPAGSSQLINQRLWNRRKAIAHSLTRALLARPNIKGVDTLVCQNEAVATQWRVGVRQVIVEPNVMVPTTVTAPPADAHDQHKIVCVGGLIERKQPMAAVEMMRRLTDGYRLHLIGTGPSENELRRLVRHWRLEDRVIFEGRRSHAETLQMMATASVLVHPSRQEGAGWVVGEAQSLGLSPVVLRGSGSDTLVEIAGIGHIVAPFGDEPLADRLAAAVRAASREHPVPINRWSESRLPALLDEWYGYALEHAKAASEHRILRSTG